LVEAIRHAVATFSEVGQRFLNRDVVDTVIETNGPLFEELGRSLAREKLFDLTRRVMKSAAEMTATEAQLGLAFDISDLPLPAMIAVPIDGEHPLNGDCAWVPVMQATLDDLDANLRMLDLQIESDQRKRRQISMLRQLMGGPGWRRLRSHRGAGLGSDGIQLRPCGGRYPHDSVAGSACLTNRYLSLLVYVAASSRRRKKRRSAVRIAGDCWYLSGAWSVPRWRFPTITSIVSDRLDVVGNDVPHCDGAARLF